MLLVPITKSTSVINPCLLASARMVTTREAYRGWMD